MCEFSEVICIVYLAKLLHEIDRFHAIEHLQAYALTIGNEVDYDIVYEISLSAMAEVFEYTRQYYNEDKGISTIVLADQAMTDYYTLAGAFGKRKGLSDKANPYFRAAEMEASRWLGFSYCISWQLRGFAEPKRPFQSKLVILTDENDFYDITNVAIGVAGMYRFFSEECAELQKLLSEEEVAAA